jgi:restriction system protein
MKKNLNFIEFLAQIPWWVSVSLSALFYVFLKFALPAIQSQSNLVSEVDMSLGPALAPVVALALLSPLSFSLLRSGRRKKLHALKEEIEKLQELSWTQFRDLAVEAYRKKGYTVMEKGNFQNDPAVDIVLRKGANLYLLQCRYWLNSKLRKREVKNLYALMHARQASGAFLLTTGIFTREARHYAVVRPITLVEGIKLVELFSEVQESRTGGLLS